MYRPWGRAAILCGILVILSYTFKSSLGFNFSRKISAAPSNLVSSVKWPWSDHEPADVYREVPPGTLQHPIIILAQEGQARLDRQLDRQSKSLKDATAEYKRRYGKRPPSGFDKWYEMAAQNNATIIDDFDVIMLAWSRSRRSPSKTSGKGCKPL